MPDCRIDVTRIPGGSDTPPHLKISHNTFETMEKANWEFLRLSLPVTCMGEFISEAEKARRWEEIKMRQYRLMREAQEIAQQQTSAHMDHMLKSGFSMNDIKGLNRNYDDTAEADENMTRSPARPPRRASMTRNITFESDLGVSEELQRSTSALDMNGIEDGGAMDDKKKRGRSPFKFFSKKTRDQSKDKLPGRAPEVSPERRTAMTQGRSAAASQLTAKAPSLRLNNVSSRRTFSLHSDGLNNRLISSCRRKCPKLLLRDLRP